MKAMTKCIDCSFTYSFSCHFPSRGVLSVSFWAEQQINSDFSMHASDILGIIPTDDTLEGIYLTFELARSVH